jgi:hypothetical protein
MRYPLRRAPGNRSKAGAVHYLRPWTGGPKWVTHCGHNAATWMPVTSENTGLVTCRTCLSLMAIAPGGDRFCSVHSMLAAVCPCLGT